jgi:hypothetical protein
MSREYYFGDEARVQCYKGYKLTASNIIKCGIGQEFLNPPKCEGEYITYFTYYLKLMMKALNFLWKSAYESVKTEYDLFKLKA